MQHYDFEKIQAAITRIAPLREKYIETPRDNVVRTNLNLLIATRANNVIASQPNTKLGMMLTGASGAGKSTMLQRQLSRHPALAVPAGDDDQLPYVSFRIESPITLKSLGLQTLHKLGYAMKRSSNKADYWNDVRDQLQLRRVQILHFDEAQDIFESGTKRDIRELLGTFKGLMSNPRWPTIVLISGIPILGGFVKQDFQLTRRLFDVPLESITAAQDGDAIAWQIAEYAKLAALTPKLPADLAARLIHAAATQLGLAFEITLDAMQEALLVNAKSLSIQHFADAYERQTMCNATLNPFLADDWQNLPLLRARHDELAPSPVRPRRAPKRGETAW